MTPTDPTGQQTPIHTDYRVVTRPVPPDQISPKAVVLRIVQLKNVAKRNWKLLLLLTLIGGVIGFVVDLVTRHPITYDAHIKFNLGGGSSNSFGELGSLASAFGLGQSAPDASIFSGENFIIYARSRPVVEKTLMKTARVNGKDTLLVNYYIKHGGIREKEWEDEDNKLHNFYFSRAKKPEEYNKWETIAMSQIYGRIKSEMTVTQPERKSSFMDLEAFLEDEDFCKVFVEKHLETIEADYKQKQTKKTTDMMHILSDRTDSLRRLLTGTENQLADYIDRNQQVVVAQGRMTETKLTRNSTFLTQLYYQAQQNLDNMRLSLVREAPLFTIIEPVSLPLYKNVPARVGIQAGLALGLLLGIIIIFVRETYRSIMREE